MRVQALLAASIVLVAAALAAACSDAPNPNALGGGDPAGTDNGQGASSANPGSSSGNVDGGKPGTPGNHGGGLPCDVSAIMQSECQLCHAATPAYGAPMPLVTYADLTAQDKIDPTKKVYEAVKARVHASTSPMPPSPSPPMAAKDLATIDAWIAAGTPPSNDSCEGNADAGTPPKQLSCKPDQFIRATTPFTMPAGTPDIYMCYGFDVTPAQKRHVIGFAPQIDNPKIVHHLLLFQSDTAYSTTPQQCSATTSVGWRLVTGWAPGGQPMEAPPEAGFPEEGATHWILQVHYNNASGANAGQVDKSGYDMCTTDQLRPNDADVMATGTLSANIPPRAMTDITCDWTPSFIGKLHVFSTTPHMHKLGKIMSTYVNRNGQSIKVVDQQNFDFNYQVGFPANVDFQDGDTISTRCGWNNTTDQTVTWGENTGDEMCFNFIAYYPKLNIPLWSWTSPSMVASCNPTK